MRTPLPNTIWTYAYHLAPSQAEERLQMLNALLAKEHADALRESRTWAARVVLEERITQILVVTDSPELDGQANARLQAVLKELNVAYTITVPMAVEDQETPSS